MANSQLESQHPIMSKTLAAVQTQQIKQLHILSNPSSRMEVILESEKQQNETEMLGHDDMGGVLHSR